MVKPNLMLNIPLPSRGLYLKRICAISLFFLSVAFIWAEKPHRFFELGIDVDAGFANNLLGWNDIVNSEEKVTLDFTDLNAILPRDFDIGVSAGADVFLNFNAGQRFGFGLFCGVDVLSFTKMSHRFFKMLTDNSRDREYDDDFFNLGASVYAEAGVKTSFYVKRFKVGVSPTMFIPLIYMPSTPINMKSLTANGRLYAEAKGDADVYMAVPLFGVLGSIEGAPEALDLGALLQSAGYDLSLYTEYPLFSSLDVGGSLSHIPLYPGHLTDRYRYSFEYQFPNNPEGLDAIKEVVNDTLGDIFSNLGDPELNGPDFLNDKTLSVYRPMRFDLYFLFRPFESNVLVLRPNLGFSLFNLVDPFCFNAGVEAQYHLWQLLSLSLGTSYTDFLWRHQFILALNLRIFELDVNIGLQSQNFAGSLKYEGLGVSVGIRVGF
jgi:hypothetical protein